MAPTSRPSSSASTYCESENTASSFASTLTFVNPAPPLSLVWDRNSVISATIYSRDGPLYKITTNNSVTRTELCDLTEQRVLATVKRREIFPDVVVFAHHRGKSIRIKKWLKRQKMPGIQQMTKMETSSGKFIWKSDSNYRFALYSEDHTATPIAYSRTLRDPPTIGLVVSRCSDTVQIEIITSFLILEQKLRMKEKSQAGETLHGLQGRFVRMG